MKRVFLLCVLLSLAVLINCRFAEPLASARSVFGAGQSLLCDMHTAREIAGSAPMWRRIGLDPEAYEVQAATAEQVAAAERYRDGVTDFCVRAGFSALIDEYAGPLRELERETRIRAQAQKYQ